jgi:hypothetical protein
MFSNNFSSEFDAASKQIEMEVQAAVKSAATELFDSIVSDTPVRTGHLQSMWKNDIGSFSLGSSSVIAIENDTEYSAHVEMGTERNRPAGMVRRNIMRWSQILKRHAG